MKLRTRIFSAALAATLSISPLSAFAASDFEDVPADAWYAAAVHSAADAELFNGVDATHFAPTATMTRAMFVTVLGRMLGADTSAAAPAAFEDVPANEWYTAAVNWAYENHYVNGTGATTFSPVMAITREQIAVIVANYLTASETEIKSEGDVVTAYGDAASVSSWAVSGVETMRKTGLMNGDEHGNFNPQKELSRAEAATVFVRLKNALDALKNSENEKDNGDAMPTEPTKNPEPEVTTTPEPEETAPAKDLTLKNNGESTGIDPQRPVESAVSYKELEIPSGPEMQIGESDEGLTAAGTVDYLGYTIEQEKYVEMADGIIGTATTRYSEANVGTEYENHFHLTYIDYVMYLGDKVTINSKDFGVDKWFSVRETANVKQISDSVVTITANKLTEANTWDTVGYISAEDDETGTEILIEPHFRVYEKRPATMEADFHLDTDYDRMYYSNSNLEKTWRNKKGNTSIETLELVPEEETWCPDYIRIYPDASAGVAKSDLTAQGYVKAESVHKYYTVEMEDKELHWLGTCDLANVSVGNIFEPECDDIATITITSLKNGTSCSIDIAVQYYEP